MKLTFNVVAAVVLGGVAGYLFALWWM